MSLNTLPEAIDEAFLRIKGHCLRTPLIESYPFGDLCGCRVWLKLESEQLTGSFKVRGSLNKVLSLSQGEIKRGLVTASTGNHGLGFGQACLVAGIKGRVYLPRNASPAKVGALKYFPVDLEFVDGTSLETELVAKKRALEDDLVWVSPYNDLDVIAGQGTIAKEMLSVKKDLDYVLVTVGGGGMIAGIGSYIKHHRPETKIIACQPKNSPEMTLSLKAGKIVDLPKALPTLSDGSAGGIEANSITFPICQEVIDDCILVDETEIAAAMQLCIQYHHKIIEGAAGVALAALIQQKSRFKDARVAVVVCGANVSDEVLKTLFES